MPRRSSFSTGREATAPASREAPKKPARRRSRKGNSQTKLTRSELEQMVLAGIHERPKR